MALSSSRTLLLSQSGDAGLEAARGEAECGLMVVEVDEVTVLEVVEVLEVLEGSGPAGDCRSCSSPLSPVLGASTGVWN